MNRISIVRNLEAECAHAPCAQVLYQGRPVLKVIVASSFMARARGLLGRPSLGTDEAMLIRPCSAIHTFGMRYALDIAFLDKAGIVLKLKTAAPSRFVWCRGAYAVLEMQAGTIRRLSLEIEQKLLVDLDDARR